MNIRLSEEERMLQSLFADFFAREFTPSIARQSEYDLGGAGQERGFRLDLWRSLIDLGALQLTLPVDAGGVGLGEEAAVVLAQQMGRAAYHSPYVEIVAALDLIKEAGPESLIRNILADMLSGTCMVTLAVPHSPQVEAVWAGSGWRIAGEARRVPFARQADYLLLIQGTRFFLVAGRAPGVIMRRHDEIGRGEVYAVRFEGVTVSATESAELPALAVERALAKARVRQSAYLIGLSQGALELTLKYTRERHQFGQEIASFQSPAFRMAAMAARIEAARLLACHTAWETDAGRDIHGISLQLLAMAGDLAREVTTEAIQLHGSFGISEEAEPQRYYRRAIADSLLWGRAAEHRAESVRLLGEAESLISRLPSLRQGPAAIRTRFQKHLPE